MLNATVTPQQNAAPPDQLKTVLGGTPPTPPSVTPTAPPFPTESSSAPTPTSPNLSSFATIPNAPTPTTPSSDEQSFDNTVHTQNLPPFRPSSFTGSAHPPTPMSDVKHDISDTTERDSSYATALATKVGGSAPAVVLTKASSLPDGAVSDHKTVGITTSVDGKKASIGSTPPTPPAPPSTPPKKKGGKFNVKIAGSIVAVLVLLGGLGAGYYLQTQQQDLQQKAYTPGSAVTTTIKDVLKVYHASESTACPVLTDTAKVEACVQDLASIRTNQTNNDVSTYAATVGFENITDKTLEVVFSNESYWCKDKPLGYSWQVPENQGRCSIGCADSANKEDKVVTIEPGKRVDLSISRSSDDGEACGSFQLDWMILKITKGSSVIFDSADSAPLLASWGMCQTGGTCQAPATVSGKVECIDPTGKAQNISSINEGTVTVGDKDYPIVDGSYSADGVTSGQMIAARINLPATFTVNIDGKPVVVKKESTTLKANNACDTSFMNNSCGGINAERAASCSQYINVVGSYEWCTLPKNVSSHTGFDFTVTGCTAPTVDELACVGTTLTPAAIQVGGTNQMTLTCTRVAGAKSYKLIVPSNTATQSPVTEIKPAPASGNLTYLFNLNAVPAGTYNASCVPCTGADGTGCITPIAASCKASVTASKSIVGKAICESKTAYTLNAGSAKVSIAGGSTTTAGGTIMPGQEFMYDVTVTATEETTGEITVVDTLPSKLTFVSAALDNGTPVTTPSSTSFFRAMSGGRLTFVHPVFGQNATTAAPAKFVITLKVKVTEGAAPGDVTNSATITTANATNSTSTCSHKAVIPPDGVASCVSKEMFAVTGTTVGAKIADGSNVTAGSTVHYAINLKATTQTAGSVTVTDKLSTDLELVDKMDFDYNTSTRVLSKTLTSFAGEKILTARVKVKSDTTATSITNTATVKTVNAGNTTINTNTCAASMKIPSYACNSDCSTTEQCQTANADYLCSAANNNRCRLTGNESSETCQPKTFACNSSCGTDADCRTVNTNYSCVSTTDGRRCRLSTNQSATNCLPATSTPTPTPTVGCNQSCSNNADCTNPDHICYNTGSANVCRLAADVNSTTCTTTTSTPIASTAAPTVEPTAPPAELPQSGPESWATWLKTGLVVIGIGAMLLLLI